MNSQTKELKGLIDEFVQTLPNDERHEWYCIPREVADDVMGWFLLWLGELPVTEIAVVRSCRGGWVDVAVGVSNGRGRRNIFKECAVCK